MINSSRNLIKSFDIKLENTTLSSERVYFQKHDSLLHLLRKKFKAKKHII